MNEFLKAVIQAENDYSKAIQRAVKPLKDELIKKQNEKTQLAKALTDVYDLLTIALTFKHGFIS